MRTDQERHARTRSRIIHAVALLVAAALAAWWGVASGSIDHGDRDLGPASAATLPAWHPVVFEPNRGQADEPVRFIARGAGGQLHLADDSMLFVTGRPMPARAHVFDGTATIRARFLGAARWPRVAGRDPLPSRSHYFFGGESTRTIDVPHFAAVTYEAIYPGIDLIWYGERSGFEFDLVVAPGADPSRIRLAFEGAERISLDADGSVVLGTAAGELRFRPPTFYQRNDDERRIVDGRYVLEDDTTIGIDVGRYDAARTLLIDPVLAYSTYLGGSGQDTVYGIATDTGGNVYVAGSTTSTDFPVANAFQPAMAGSNAAFVSKFTAAGALVYSTYVTASANGYASANGIAVDSAGSAYITGQASPGLPVTRGAYQSKPGGSTSAFVAKLAPAGNQLVYATYVQYANAHAIAVDSAGAAYVTGEANAGFATTNGAFQTITTNDQTYFTDAFIVKLNAAGTAAAWSTRLGGTHVDAANSIAVDASGQAVVTGDTCSPSFPLAKPLQSSYAAPGANCHAFVTRLNAAGSALVWSTFLGGSGSEEGNALALDAQGNVYVAGSTSSADFPLERPYQSVNANLPNPGQFVAKIAAAGDRLLYSTFIGGTCGGTYYPYCDSYVGDNATGIAVDSAGRAVVVGAVRSPYLPLVDSIEGPIPAKSTGIFAIKFVPAGNAVLYSTVIGGGGSFATGVAIDASGNAWIAGATGLASFPVTSGARQTTYRGAGDGVLVRIAPSTTSVTLASSANPVTVGGNLTISAAVSGSPTGGTVYFMDGATQVGSATVVDGSAMLAQALPVGIRRLSALYRDGSNEADSAVLYQVVNPPDACP